MWQLVSVLLFCSFSNAFSATPNVTVQVCREHRPSADQQWAYVSDDHTIRPLHTDWCLTTESNGSRSISLTPCVIGLNFYQVWQLNAANGEITDLLGKCLGVHYRTVLKPTVELTPCTGRANQRWAWKEIALGGLLRNKLPWKSCLTHVY